MTFRLHQCPYCLGTGHVIAATCHNCTGTGVTDAPTAARIPAEVEPADQRSVTHGDDW